jgi:4-diphosphocytidyl-2-C-methyl-D-erythritol kinase
VNAPLVERACAKINLTLRVVGRRADGYHEIESLVAFADVCDRLVLEPGAAEILDITGPFAAACGAGVDNLVLKAAAALRQRIGALKSGRFLLEKNLPVAAGIGGGSADAGAALRLLAALNAIAQDDPRLTPAALAVGADVPVCLAARGRVMRGVGEILSAPLAMPSFPALLVNPGVPLATRDVFAAFAGGEGGRADLADLPGDPDAFLAILARCGNDLTRGAMECAPVVQEVLAALQGMQGVALARMSGSGPTCFALFRSPAQAAAAMEKLAGERKDWWVRAATIG